MYRHAHWYVLAVSLATLSGFVPTYVRATAVTFRVHVAASSRACRHRQRVDGAAVRSAMARCARFAGCAPRDDSLGWTSLVVFPLAAATSIYIVWFAAAADLTRGGVYPKLYWLDFWTVPLMLFF